MRDDSRRDRLDSVGGAGTLAPLPQVVLSKVFDLVVFWLLVSWTLSDGRVGSVSFSFGGLS